MVTDVGDMLKKTIEKGLKDYQAKSIKISGKSYNLHLFSEDEDLNLFEGFLFVEPEEKDELSYLISRYRAPVSGYVPRLSLLLHNEQLIIKDYRKNKLIRKTSRKVNKTFISKLKKALNEPTETNFNKLFDRTDIIEEFYILYKKARDYLLENVKGISEEGRRLDFVDNFMMQMLTLWYLQEKGFFNEDNSYFITKFKDLKQKNLSGGFDSYYQFLTHFFEKIKDGDTPYYEDATLGKVVIVGPAIFLDSGDEEAITIPDKCFYTDGMTEVLINTAPKKVSQDVPLLNLFESRDWVEGDIDEFVLGALYEKLMTEDVKKKTGSYYTPEEITSYISKNTIEPYLVDRVNEESGRAYETIDQIIEADDKGTLLCLFENLKEIKVLDPAVGSAHFLESAINVLLAVYEKIWEKAKEMGLRKGLEIIAADEEGKIKQLNLLELGDKDEEQLRMLIKFFIILSKNVYGVDINPSAINIAKARLFLTIAKHFKAGKYFVRFPTVHFNLRDGNSLIGYVKKGEEKEGVKTERGQLSLDFYIKEKEAIYIVEAVKVVSELRSYLIETAKTLGVRGDILKEVEELNKILSKKEIKWSDFEKVLRTKEKLISILIASLNSHYARPLNELLNKITELFNQKLDEKFAKEYNIDFDELREIKTFHWIFEFPEVFLDREGFDIVVGNPPYVNIYNIEKTERLIYPRFYDTAYMKFDIYVIFIDRGLNLLKSGGQFSFIVSNKIKDQKYALKLRERIIKEDSIRIFIDSSNVHIFYGVGIKNIIIVIKKGKLLDNVIKFKILDNSIKELDEAKYMCMNQKYLEDIPLYCFRFDLRKTEKNISDYIKGCGTLFKNIYYISRGLTLGNYYWKDYSNYLHDKRTIKKFIKGKNIHRYYITYEGEEVVYKKDILTTPGFSELFENTKLIFKKITSEITGAIDRYGFYIDATGILAIPFTSIIGKRKFSKENLGLSTKLKIETALILLNSSLLNFYFKKILYEGNFLPDHLKKLPVIIPPKQNIYEMQCEIMEFVSHNKEKTRLNAFNLFEHICNSLVYELYFKEKFAEDGLYPEPKEYLLELVSKHLKPINYDRWSELYWKKQLEEKLTTKEEKELEKLEKENLKITEGVYNALIKDKEIQEQIERIKEHEWVKVIEGE